HRYGVFASRWPLKNATVWTIVNRNEYDVDGRQMSVPRRDGVRYFDLYHGVEIKPSLEPGTDVLSFPLEAHGYGAVMASASEPASAIRELMSRMKTVTERPLSSFSNEWKTVPQQLVEI